MVSHNAFVARGIADAFLAGPWTLEGFAERAAKTLGESPPWLAPLAGSVLRTFGSSPQRPSRQQLADLVAADPGYQEACRQPHRRPRIHRYALTTPGMSLPPPALEAFEMPAIDTPGAVADWLELEPRELDWFADRWGSERHAAPGPLRHYVYRWVPKRYGGARLLEIPKSRLREMQRRILRSIVAPIPPHDSAHGFRRGHSCLTYANPHVGRPLVLRIDLSQFFPCIAAGRVHALFKSLGYPQEVAAILTGLCTNCVPADALAQGATQFDGRGLAWKERARLRTPHLPQGAPTSPAIANLCAFRLDLRLAGLARAMGASYTRYADDLAFSGGELTPRAVGRFQLTVCRIAWEEGFAVNMRKTRVMSRGVRQQLVGVVINERPNIRRRDFDRLKAILHNCIRFGPRTQSRDHPEVLRQRLAGRISHVKSLNPNRARRLEALYERIHWD